MLAIYSSTRLSDSRDIKSAWTFSTPGRCSALSEKLDSISIIPINLIKSPARGHLPLPPALLCQCTALLLSLSAKTVTMQSGLRYSLRTAIPYTITTNSKCAIWSITSRPRLLLERYDSTASSLPRAIQPETRPPVLRCTPPQPARLRHQ